MAVYKNCHLRQTSAVEESFDPSINKLIELRLRLFLAKVRNVHVEDFQEIEGLPEIDDIRPTLLEMRLTTYWPGFLRLSEYT